MTEDKKEVTIKEEGSITDLIRMGLSGGADLQELKDLLELKKEWETNEARKEYHKAMSGFKSEPIDIDKDKHVGYNTSKGKVGYSHASLANVVKKITAGLSKYGLSASWRTQQNGAIIVTCRITHEKGHHEETSLSANADDSGSKNSIQAIGSTITYLERYTILALTGLVTSGQDQDGVVEDEKIEESKLKILRDLMTATKTDESTFLTYLEVEKLEDLPKSGFAKAKLALETKKGNK